MAGERLSEAQERVLLTWSEGGYDRGGNGRTLKSLRRLGLIGADRELTEAGWARVAALREKETAERDWRAQVVAERRANALEEFDLLPEAVREFQLGGGTPLRDKVETLAEFHQKPRASMTLADLARLVDEAVIAAVVDSRSKDRPQYLVDAEGDGFTLIFVLSDGRWVGRWDGAERFVILPTSYVDSMF